MNVWMKSLLALLGALVGGATATAAVGGYSWNRQTEQMLERLRQTTHDPEPAAFSADELRGLPAPVVRYFEFALTPGQPMVRSARIEHQGEFRSGLDQKWSPFHSVQHFTVAQPGFVWDARIRMIPLLGVRVRDSYIAGEAGMLGKLGGTIAVIDQAGTPSLNSGALHRYFMERAWLPTALLPSQGVRWEPIDDTSARAFFADHGIALSMDVFFGEQGEIVRVEAMRMRDVDGVGVLTPFVGHFRDYQRVDGMMVPIAGEVEWVLPEGRLNFWRGRVTEARYEFAAQPGTR